MATENNKVGKEERAKELNLSYLPAPHVIESPSRTFSGLLPHDEVLPSLKTCFHKVSVCAVFSRMCARVFM